jgi:ABC-type transport system involved in multi-copper enzyme maturation permease subunit
MRTLFRLLIKAHRFELIAITLACLALAGGELFLSHQLEAVEIPRQCLFSVGSGPQLEAPDPALDPACQVKRDAFYPLDQNASEILAFGAVMPVLAGMLLGVAVVGRELETGTASLAWTLSRSRRRWYLTRALLLGAIVAGVLFIPALTAEVLERARYPLLEPSSSLNDGGVRGPIFVERGLVAFAVGIVAGAILGRQLPALIVTIALSLVVLLGFETGVGSWERSLAEWRPAAEDLSAADLSYDQQYQDRVTGALVDQQIVWANAPQVNGGPDDAWIGQHYILVSLVLPGNRYGLIVMGETAALGGLTFLLLGAGLLIVDRRRPG